MKPEEEDIERFTIFTKFMNLAKDVLKCPPENQCKILKIDRWKECDSSVALIRGKCIKISPARFCSIAHRPTT